MQASALLLRWGSYRRAHNLRFLIVYLFFFPPFYVALCASKAQQRFGSEKVSWCLETSLFLRLPSRNGTPSLPLLSLFLSFIFFPTSFRRVGLLFWVPDVLCRHSEVFCGIYSTFKCSFDEFVGENVFFPVLLLRHLGSSPPNSIPSFISALTLLKSEG